MTDPLSYDEMAGLERAATTLRRLPIAADGAALAAERITAAALARHRAVRRRNAWLARAAMFTLAGGLTTGGVWYGRRSAPHTIAATSAARDASDGVPATPPSATHGADRPVRGTRLAAAGGATEEAPIDVPFALHRPAARRVAVVGDFDEWSPTAVPMTRATDGTWTATVALPPGRHAYAFVVDDSVWVTDPRAVVVRDADYGRDQSVLVVGRP